MNKAAQLSKQLEKLPVDKGMELILKIQEEGKPLHFDVIDDVMCIMHDDGSVNMIENQGGGIITGEVISAENILKVLHHYRPFVEVFKGHSQN